MHLPAANPRPRRFAALLALSLAILGMLPGASASADEVLLSPPATGPVVRGFEEPAGTFGAGHRGLDIAVPPGAPIHAAADGTVAFAGVVAGARFVTLMHPRLIHGLETTYSFLSRIDVRPGSAVKAGDVIGASGAGHPGEKRPALHFGVRRDGRYVDPAPMLRLEPSDVPDDVSDLVALGPLPDERAEPPGTTGPPAGSGPGSGPAARRSGPAGPAGPSPVTARPPAILDPTGGGRSAGSLGWLGRGLARQLHCSRAGGSPPPALPTAAELQRGARPPVAPNDNVVIAVAGIGSSTWTLSDGSFGSDAAMYQLDLRTLGYAADRIFHFSYRGVPSEKPESRGGPGVPYRFHQPYGREDTFRPIAGSAALLQQLVDRVHAAHPGRRIDIVAHSQGGIVAEHYLERQHDPRRAGGPVIDHLVTIASPHLGADLAALGGRLDAAGTSPPASRAIDRLAGALGAPPPSSPATRDLAVGSRMIEHLARRWTGTVKTTTIAAGLDLVVPAQRTRLPGAAHYTVDLPNGSSSLWAHTAIVEAGPTKQIVYGALSDHPAPCTALRDAIADHVSGPLVSAMQGRFLDALTEAAAPGAAVWP